MKRYGLGFRRGALLATAIALLACAPCVLAVPDVGSGELFWKSPAGLVPMPVVSMTVGYFTPSLIGYEPFFRARDALRITLRVSLEDKDDSPD